MLEEMDGTLCVSRENASIQYFISAQIHSHLNNVIISKCAASYMSAYAEMS